MKLIILQCSKKILEIMNKPEDLIEFVEDRPGHDFRYSLNSSKDFWCNLGWRVKSNFDDGLRKHNSNGI